MLSSLSPGMRRAQAAAARSDALPADMSTTSLVGGGLIAGESLYALGAGIAGLLGAAIAKLLGRP